MVAIKQLWSGGCIPGLPKESLCGFGQGSLPCPLFVGPPERYFPWDGAGEPGLLFSES